MADLTLRSVKGVDLTPAEEEANHVYHHDRAQALIDNPPTAVSVTTTVETLGNNIRFVLTDGTKTNWITMPRPQVRLAAANDGVWAPSTSYAAGEFVRVPGDGIYLVLVSHISPATFDAAHQDGGEDAYDLWLPTDVTYDLVFTIGATSPTAGEVIMYIPIPRAVRIPANFAGSTTVPFAIWPSTDYPIDVRVDNVSIGTVTVSSAGVPSYVTDGGVAIDIPADSMMTIVAPDQGTAQDTIGGGGCTFRTDLLT